MNVPGTYASSGMQSQTADSIKDRMSLGKDDFMKLLITELRYQDAMNPVDDREMIAQLAQFSSLEQMQNLSAKIGELAKAQKAIQATSLIGKTITFIDAEGNRSQGKVESCEFYGDNVYLTINDEKISFADILKVS